MELRMTMPDPPPSVVRVYRMRAAAMILIGLALLGMVVVVGLLLQEVHQANDRADMANAETQCYRQLTTREDSLEGEINTRGWLAILHFYGGATEEQTKARADQVQTLVTKWEEAQARRDNAANLCNQEEEEDGKQSAYAIP